MLRRIWVREVRNLAEQAMEPGPGLNLFVGRNGSGKSSLLEACHVLAIGRSFRTHLLARIARSGAGGFAVAAGLQAGSGGEDRVAVEWSRQDGRRSRLNGEWLPGHWEVARRFPVVAVHADSFALLAGSPDERRRLLDWGAFHLNSGFSQEWSTWRRAHDQRNAALRQGDREAARRFERIAAEPGERLSAMRADFLQRLERQWMGEGMTGLLQDLEGPLALAYRRGWPEEECLEAAYARSRASDLERGFGQIGPQRADFDLRLAGRSVREASRGEQKRILHAVVLAQGGVLAEVGDSAREPVLLLDDAVAEMDEAGLGGIFASVSRFGWQCLATTVDGDWAEHLADRTPGTRMFHVEHGRIGVSRET
jgi:DNA replication and repair protein RecF